MKKSFIYVPIVALLLATTAHAQENIREWKQWTVGASYIMSSSYTSDPYNNNPLQNYYSNEDIRYSGFSINAAYRFHVYKSFMFHPNLSLVYMHQIKNFNKPMIEGGTNYDSDFTNKKSGFGMNVAFPVGFHLTATKLNFDLETGPVLNFRFTDMYQYKYLLADWHPTYTYRKFGASWRFGITANLNNGLSFNVSYDVRMTNMLVDYYGYSIKPGMLSVGLGYNF